MPHTAHAVTIFISPKMEQKLSLSTHILDVNLGKPAEGVSVKLFKLVNNSWIESNQVAVTDRDGRFRGFDKINDEVCGIYKLRFETSEYFSRMNVESFHPFVEVRLN